MITRVLGGRAAASRAISTVAVITAIALAGGCASAPSPRYYSLASAPDSANVDPMPSAGGSEPRQSGALVVAIGAIGLPDQVDRPQIVTVRTDRGGAQRIIVSEEHRWVASLQSQIARVLAEKLAQTLATQYVTTYPQDEAQSPDFRISVNVQRFDAQIGDEAVVDAIWTVRDTASGRQLSGHRLAHAAIAGGGDEYRSVVAALRVAVDQVAEGVVETAGALNAMRGASR